MEHVWRTFQRKGYLEARPYEVGEDLSGISVSDTDSPKIGDMIARNPQNHADQWLISLNYFESNYSVLREDDMLL